MKPVRIPNMQNTPYSIYYELPGDAVGDPEMIIAELVASVEELKRKSDNVVLRMDRYNPTRGAKVHANPIDRHVISGWHRHDFFELNYVFSGRVYEYVEDRVTILKDGDFMVMHPNVFHAVYAEPGVYAFNILIDADFFREIAARMDSHIRGGSLSYLAGHNAYIIYSSVKKGVMDDAVFEICSMFRHYIEPPRPCLRDPLRGAADIYLLHRNTEVLLARIAACETAGEIGIVRRGSMLYADKFDRVIEYIRANIATVTAEDTAQRFGYSRMQLYRIIKAHFGIGFKEYVMSVRLRQAQTLLVETELEIAQICRSLGLSEEYFYRFFKKRLNITPARFRKMSEKERYPLMLP